MISFGGGSNRSSGSGQSFVWGPQAGFLQSLYGQATNASNALLPNIQGTSQGLVNGLMGNAGPWASPGQNPAIANLMERATVGNPYLNQQISGLAQDYGNMFRNQILPGIQSSAGLAGQFGGSRQGIAAGLAAGDISGQFARAATGLRSNAYQQGITSALGAGQLASQGIGQMGDLYNLGMSPSMAPFMPLQALSGILGSPTVLQKNRNSSSGWNINGSFLGG